MGLAENCDGLFAVVDFDWDGHGGRVLCWRGKYLDCLIREDVGVVFTMREEEHGDVKESEPC